MAKDVNLLNYWMPILRQLKEFEEIANTEEPELKLILEAIDRTLNNMFIETADESGIERFEKILGITPSDEDTLDTRRFRVLVKWNDSVPYTDKELYNKLLSLCGSEDKFDINSNYEDYFLEIITHLGVVGAFDTVISMLEEMLPCNLILNVQNVLNEISETTGIRAVLVTSTAMSYLITNDISETVNTTDGFTVASPVSTANVLTLN